MAINVIMFDLDGTLLPMDQDEFVRSYFGHLAGKIAPRGYEPKALIGAVWQGTEAMIKNAGEENNETVFWKHFAEILGEDARKEFGVFEEFYNNEFDAVQQSCGFNAQSAETVKTLKEMGMRLVLATNPIFPSIATEKRVKWAGLDICDFEHYTTYENSNHCKPNLEYYMDILEIIGAKPEECLMVGNDVGDDMVAEKLGIKVFLLTDCLINKNNADISVYPHGSFCELIEYINEFNMKK